MDDLTDDEARDMTYTSCEYFGHQFSLDDDTEQFEQCLACGEPREH